MECLFETIKVSTFCGIGFISAQDWVPYWELIIEQISSQWFQFEASSQLIAIAYIIKMGLKHQQNCYCSNFNVWPQTWQRFSRRLNQRLCLLSLVLAIENEHFWLQSIAHHPSNIFLLISIFPTLLTLSFKLYFKQHRLLWKPVRNTIH